MKSVQRGYHPNDRIAFGDAWKPKLIRAANELTYLLNRGYDIKSSSTFIGNHYMLSQRQRIALTRIVSGDIQLENRKKKKLTAVLDYVNIDGFNTIITLEVALSQSLLLKGYDGTIRDLAGLRGTYRIIDKTEASIRIILTKLDELNVKEAVFFLDKPVSNSGNLCALILQLAKEYFVNVTVKIINNVDQTLEKLEHVVTSDAIILDKCISWHNLLGNIMDERLEDIWLLDLNIS